MPGQNSGTPSQKLFRYHAVLKYGLRYYDPSYGVIYEWNALSAERNFQDMAIKAYGAPATVVEGKWRRQLLVPDSNDVNVEFKPSKPDWP